MQVKSEWEAVVYGKTEDQRIMTEQARQYLGSTYPSSACTSRALVLWGLCHQTLHPSSRVAMETTLLLLMTLSILRRSGVGNSNHLESCVLIRSVSEHSSVPQNTLQKKPSHAFFSSVTLPMNLDVLDLSFCSNKLLGLSFEYTQA